MARHNPDGILLIATNPVDVLTYASQELSGLPPQRVIGSGTILDTARFRHLIEPPLRRGRPQRPRLDRRRARRQRGAGLVAGQHRRHAPAGRSAPPWASPLDEGARDWIFAQTRDAAYQIIERKGATYYAIGAGLVRIVEAILRDQRTVLSVASRIDGYYGLAGLCFSLPTVIDRGGVQQVIHLPLSDAEQTGLQRSAAVLQGYLEALA